MPQYATVAVGIALDRHFNYRVPPPMQSAIAVGMRVLVPFGHRATTGYVLELPESVDYQGTLKEITELLDERPTFNTHLMEFLRWVARYYQVPLGELMRKALPPSLHATEKARVLLTEEGRDNLAAHPHLERLQSPRGLSLARVTELMPRGQLDGLVEQGLVRIARAVERGGPGATYERILRIGRYDEAAVTSPKQKQLVDLVWQNREVPYTELKQLFTTADRMIKSLVEKGVLEEEKRRLFRAPEEAMESPAIPARLSLDQASAMAPIEASLASARFAPFLLQGVTGSGKTEVYLRTIDAVLARGRTALVLVPEIALTPQLMAAFEGRFSKQVAILHSALSPGERLDQWTQVAAGQLPIVLGARSAIFAPLEDLGLIVVDEEHEPSFKQDERPFYNARDLALVRGRMAGATVLLGSATPSLESRHNADQGRYGLLHLPRRATPRPLPDVVIVDLKESGFADKERILSRPLATALQENLDAGHQSICFLNRKGYSAFFLCEACGAVPRCPHCDISLTHYRRANVMRCHYCQYGQPVPTRCPTCGVEGLKEIGFGTERVVEALNEAFPTARIARLDSDTSGGRKLARTLNAFRAREVDILIGTQIVAKGHDFPGVTLVGVLNADLGLAFPDFRAAERTFQLLTQVAGRAGRGEVPGQVLVQTWLPRHYALLHAQRHDFESFAQEELEHRRMRHYPPFACLALLRLSGTSLERVKEAAREAHDALSTLAREMRIEVDFLGPGMAPLSFLRKRFRMQLLMRHSNRGDLSRFLRRAGAHVYRRIGRSSAVRWSIDVDPVNLM